MNTAIIIITLFLALVATMLFSVVSFSTFMAHNAVTVGKLKRAERRFAASRSLYERKLKEVNSENERLKNFRSDIAERDAATIVARNNRIAELNCKLIEQGDRIIELEGQVTEQINGGSFAEKIRAVKAIVCE